MAEGYFQLPPDSTGKKVRTIEQTVGANTVEHQVMVVGDPTTPGNMAAVDSSGRLGVQNPPNLDAATSTLAKESGGNLAAAKADLDTISGQLDAKTSQIKSQTDKLTFDGTSNLKVAAQGTVTVSGTVAVSGTPTVELETDDVGLAKESGGNLDKISGQLDVKASTLAKEAGGNLATIATNTATPNIRALTTSDQVMLGDAIIALKRAIDVISHPLWWDVNLNSLKVALNVGGTTPTYASGATLPTVTTVGTVTKLSQLTANGEPVFDIFLRHTWMNAWGNVVRRCITVT
jgi:hypothetical protein